MSNAGFRTRPPVGKLWRSRPAVRTAIVLIAAASIVAGQAFAAKKKKPKQEAPPADLGPPLPADLNLASLRVKALDQLYEIDLSADQLKALRSAAAETASTAPRTPAKGTEKLATTLREFQAALLDRTDGEKIDKLRNEVVDLMDDDDVSLDDSVKITAAARAKAGAVYRQFKASQIAADLAAHADEVGDPVEMMVAATDQLREARANAAEAADAGSETDSAGLVRDTSAEVGELVAGLDETKAKAVAVEVAKWIHSHSSSGQEIDPEKRKELEQSAAEVVGNVHPMRVLDNWLQRQVAGLLSNPQLRPAIDAVLQAKQQAAQSESASSEKSK